MGLWDIVTGLVSANVGMNAENISLLLIVIGSMILMAKDFKLGIMLLFFFSGIMFLVFYAYGLNWVGFIAVFFMSLVIMVFTLYASSRSAQEGIII